MTRPGGLCDAGPYSVLCVALCSGGLLATLMALTALRRSCTSMAFWSSEGSRLSTEGSRRFRSDPSTDRHPPVRRDRHRAGERILVNYGD